MCLIKKLNEAANNLFPVLHGFSIATFLFVFDVINERKSAALFVILRYVTAIAAAFLTKAYFNQYGRFNVNKNGAAGFSKLTVWCKCVFFWGVIYFGLGIGTIMTLFLAYLSFFTNIFPSFNDVVSVCIRLSVYIYPAWIIGGFAIGNVLYIKYYHKKA
ncbi:MAG: hypothetical protein LBC77_03500 [Spirochaetaceae bacterium]|nr:hypothetical protein [Spirochaetaceae bacterium]